MATGFHDPQVYVRGAALLPSTDSGAESFRPGAQWALSWPRIAQSAGLLDVLELAKLVSAERYTRARASRDCIQASGRPARVVLAVSQQGPLLSCNYRLDVVVGKTVVRKPAIIRESPNLCGLRGSVVNVLPATLCS